MAWYHVGGCSCPVGCCDCGSSSKSSINIQRKELIEEMKAELKSYEFTAQYIDFWDRRRRVIEPANLKSNSYWKPVFIKYINEPTVEKVIAAGHALHSKFSTNPEYTPSILKDRIRDLMRGGDLDQSDKDGINAYFTDLFEYTEIVSEWR